MTNKFIVINILEIELLWAKCLNLLFLECFQIITKSLKLIYIFIEYTEIELFVANKVQYFNWLVWIIPCEIFQTLD